MARERLRVRARRLVWEYLIVVVGVLTALAVDNWNSERVDRGLERYYLSGLVADLDSATAMVVSNRDRSNQIGSAALEVLGWIRGTSAPASVSELESVIRRTTSGWPIPPESSTWTEMNQRGHVQLIDNDALRQLTIRDMEDLERLRGLLLQARDMGSSEVRTSGIYRALPPEYWAGHRALEGADLARGMEVLRETEAIPLGLEDLIVNENRRRNFLVVFESTAARLSESLRAGLGPS